MSAVYIIRHVFTTLVTKKSSMLTEIILGGVGQSKTKNLPVTNSTLNLFLKKTLSTNIEDRPWYPLFWTYLLKLPCISNFVFKYMVYFAPSFQLWLNVCFFSLFSARDGVIREADPRFNTYRTGNLGRKLNVSPSGEDIQRFLTSILYHQQGPIKIVARSP